MEPPSIDRLLNFSASFEEYYYFTLNKIPASNGKYYHQLFGTGIPDRTLLMMKARADSNAMMPEWPPGWPKPSAAGPSDPARAPALDANKKTLYHATTPEVAFLIQDEARMHRGKTGLAGGGIYFALRPEDAKRKAARHGAIAVLSATVRLGRVKTISAAGDPSITFTSLQREGYDSVLIPRDRGHEYVVYNYDQVENLARIE